MLNQFERTELIFGKEAMDKLSKAHVAVFGVGGVGGYAVEALVRSGIGAIDLIDNDKVCLSNINRQIYATHSTVDRYKVDVAAERIADISPDTIVCTHKLFYTPETADQIDLSKYDYIVDAIDTVSGKIALAVNAEKSGIHIISSMGAGNKLDPTAFEVTDIYKTSVCPLAKVMRTELRKRGIKRLKVVYSKELPVVLPNEAKQGGGNVCTNSTETKIDGIEADPSLLAEAKKSGSYRKQAPGSNAFVPSVVGLIIAGEVIKDITGIRGRGMGV